MIRHDAGQGMAGHERDRRICVEFAARHRHATLSWPIRARICRAVDARSFITFDETVEQGDDGAPVSGRNTSGRIEIDGIRYLKDISREWQTPAWTFDIRWLVFEKRIVA